jgi:hypothetical protein
VQNTAPSAANDTASTNEDTALLLTQAALTGNDSDADSDSLNVASVAGATHGTVEIVVGGPNDGKVRFVPAADYNGPASFTYKASDGTADSNSATVSITVNSIDDAPVNAAPATAVMNEDETLTFTNSPLTGLAVSDVDAGSSPVSVTLTATHGTVTLGHPSQLGVSFTSGDGTNDVSMTFAGTLSAINAALDGTSYKPDANYNGSASLTITTDDQGATGSGGPLSDTDSVLISVNAVNDEPTVDVIANPAAINEDAGEQTVNLAGIGSGAANESQSLTVSASSDNTGLIPNPTVTYTSPNATGSLKYTPVANQNGTAVITVTVQDNGGTLYGGDDTKTRTFTVTVNAVNDEPTVDVIANPAAINEDAGLQTVNLSGIGSGAANESQVLTVTATSNNTSLIPNPTVSYTSANATGSISFTPVANQNGSAVITVNVQDNGGTGNGGVDARTQTFTITVNAVNDVPTFTKGANQTVNEDSGAHTVAGWATAISRGPANESTQTVNFLVGNDNSSLFTAAGQPAIDANGALTYTSAPDANGSTIVTVQIHDSGGTGYGGVDTSASQTFTITVNPVNDSPTVTNNKATQPAVQYSDPISPVTITASDIDTAGSSLTATAQFKKDAGSFGAGLPSNLSLTQATTTANARTWTLDGNMLVPAGTYVVRVTVADNGTPSMSASTDVTIVVTTEDARAYYTGATLASTGSVTSTTANVTLAATVKDATALTPPDPYDAYPGDIRNSTVSFYDVTVTTTPKLLCTANVGLVNATDTTVGTATCNANLTASSTSGGTPYNIAIIVNGTANGAFYTNPTNDGLETIEVYIPQNNFITGGGYLRLVSSGGLCSGGANTKNNFGFNVKYNKSGTNLQGNMNTIVRSATSCTPGYTGARMYQLKGNSMTSLVTKPCPTSPDATSTCPSTATFNGKATIQDITNPLAPISVDGNASLQVTMTDTGEPGSADTIGITLWNKSGGLWFASRWSGTTTLEQLLGGGNLVVH